MSQKSMAFVTAVLVCLAGTTATANDVLVWSTGNAGGSTPGVAAYLQSTGYFDSVVGIDQSLFTLEELLAYDRLLYFSNSSGGGQDPVAIGDVLADYADTGRQLVIATFAWANQGNNTLGGRIIDEEISPFVLEGTSLYTNVTMTWNDGSIYFENVNAVSGYFHDNVRLTTDAVERGTWSDGEPLVANKANVVGVNLFPDDSYGRIGGDYVDMFANALRVPEPASLALLALGGLAVVRRRR